MKRKLNVDTDELGESKKVRTGRIPVSPQVWALQLVGPL